MTWGAAGLVAFALAEAGGRIGGDVLAWNHAGLWVAGGTLVVAAAYELTPLKDVCLGKCRSPLGFLLGAWRDGNRGAVEMGAWHAAWCLGCCWGLMAALFALGVMSLTWMATIAVVVFIQKVFPRGDRLGPVVATALVALATWVVVAA